MKEDFESLIPKGRESFRVWELARILAHSVRQIEFLIEEGRLGTVVNCGRGKKKSHVVSRVALIKFLEENSE